MSSQTTESTQQESSIITILKKDISVLENQVVILEEKQSRSPFWLQLLRKWFTFGPVKELEWTRFKLSLKQKDLAATLQKQHDDPFG